MPKFEKHVFICTNQRPEGHPRGSCDPASGGDLPRAFKVHLAQRGLSARIRANKAGCLDQCEHGPTVVVYPEGVWYGNVSQNDVEEIVESHLVGNQPVKRLLLDESCINADGCPHKPRR